MARLMPVQTSNQFSFLCPLSHSSLSPCFFFINKCWSLPPLRSCHWLASSTFYLFSTGKFVTQHLHNWQVHITRVTELYVCIHMSLAHVCLVLLLKVLIFLLDTKGWELSNNWLTVDNGITSIIGCLLCFRNYDIINVLHTLLPLHINRFLKSK